MVDADRRRPIADATVILVDTLSARLDSTTTDADGRFTFSAPAPGTFIVHVRVDGYLSYSDAVRPTAGDTVELELEMPVVSTAAARVMRDVIQREAAFQLPWEELCEEPVRPWEAGVLVGVSRDRATMEPVPRAVVVLEPLDGAEVSGTAPPDDRAGSGGTPRTRLSTETGAFWFCNVPPGRVRVVVRADGFATDTYVATIRSGTISWYDALLRARP